MTQTRKWDVLLADDQGEPIRFVGTYLAADRASACRKAGNDVALEERDPCGQAIERWLIAFDADTRSGHLVGTRIEIMPEGVTHVGNGAGFAAHYAMTVLDTASDS